MNPYINSISNLQVIDRLSLNTEPAPDGGTSRTIFFRNTTAGQQSLKNIWTLIHHHTLIEITQYGSKIAPPYDIRTGYPYVV